MRFYLYLSILITGQISFGAQYALIAGGSGEDHKKENFFASDFKTLKSNLESRQWQVSAFFDNDTKKVPGSRIATNKNIDEGIKKIIEKLKPGDQVLLNFHAHGRDGQFPTGHHSIMTEDRKGYDLSVLDKYADLIAAKGAKLAVVDLSCYSGHTQSLNFDTETLKKTRNRACVVTLASEKYVSICSGSKASNSFTAAFIQLPKSPSVKLNLEEHFLGSREKDSSSSNLPEISSFDLPSKDFWDFFLSVGDPNGVTRKKAFQMVSTEATVCQFCEQVGKYAREIEKLGKLAEQLGGKGLSEQILNTLQDYMIADAEISSSVEVLQKKINSVPDWGFTEPVLLSLNTVPFGDMQTIIELTSPHIRLNDIKWLDSGTRERLQQLKPYREKMIAAYNKTVGSLDQDWEKYEKQKAQLEQKGKDVMAVERKLFSLYAQSQKEKTSSLCQNFSL